MKNKKVFIILSLIIVVGVLLFIFYIGKANTDTSKEFSEDTYIFEEQEMGRDVETGEQEENSTVYTPTEVK